MNFWKEFEETFFPEVKGNILPKLALVLNLVDPNCGGLVIIGESGTGKSKLLENFYHLARILKLPCKYLPSGITEENLLGEVDFERTLKTGKIEITEGILSQVKGGYLLIDDLFLFPDTILSIIFSQVHSFTLIATHNLEAGEINPHFLEKIGLVAFTENLHQKDLRKDLIKNSEKLSENSDRNLEKALYQLILAKSLIKKIAISEYIWDKAVSLCLREGAFSHRSEIFLIFAARAFTALKRETAIKEEYLENLSPLVLTHRKLKKEESWEKTPPSEEKENPNYENSEEKRKEKKSQRFENEPIKEDLPTKPVTSEKSSKDYHSDMSNDQENSSENIESFSPSASSEKVFPVVVPEKFTELLLKGKKISSYGKRITGRVKRSSSRKIRVTLSGERRELDLFATLKASLPYQIYRNPSGRVVIKREDLRFAKREGKGRTLLLLLVDGSGSMGVHQRMQYVKGVLFHFLKSSYKRRDRVALIVFRKFGAELLVSPTNSVEMAYRILKNLPVGGNTPLSAGLDLTKRVIKLYKASHPMDHILLLIFTDGKANIPLKPKGDPFEEIKILSAEISKIPNITPIVIDTEKERELLRFELAKDLAKYLKAHYFKMENLTDKTLVKILRTTL